MANTTIDDKEGITLSYSDSTPKLNKDKWQTKEERKLAETVRNRLEQMRNWMRTSCPFPDPDNVVDDDTTIDTTTYTTNATSTCTGGSYYKYLDRCDKQWIMWRRDLNDTTNLKSSISFAPIEAAMADFQHGEVMAMMDPTVDRDAEKIKLISAAHDFLYYKAKLKKVDKQTFHDTLKYGWSVRYVGYFLRQREVEKALSPKELEKALKDKNKKNDIKKLQSQNKPATKKELKTEYDDIGHVRVSPWEFLVDDNCHIFRDSATGIGEASDCIWRTTPSKEQVLAEFENSNDPYIKNIDKIKTAQDAYKAYHNEKAFFEVPNDLRSQYQVELVRYYNKRTDKYIVLANDIVIRDGPLPYDHKELPFVIHNLIEWEGKPFGVGLCGVTEALQAEDEELRSLMIQQLKMTIAPPMLYNKEYEEDIDAWQTYEAGQKIGISGPVGKDIIDWMTPPNTMFGYSQMENEIQHQSTLITGISGLTNSVPLGGMNAVRSQMMALEATQSIIAKHIDNWADARIEATWMDIKLMQQFYPLSKQTSFDDDNDEDDNSESDQKQNTRQIKTPGKQFSITKDKGSIQIESKTIKGNGFFDLEGDYLGLSGDPEIKLDIDQITKPTRAAMMQRSEQVFPLFMQALNPQVRDIPGMAELTRWIADVHQVPKRITDSLQDTSDTESKQEAMMENKYIEAGVDVPGEEGASEAHIMIHVQLEHKLLAELGSPAQQFTATPEGIKSGQMAMQKSQKVEKALEILIRHIATDMTPKGQAAGQLNQQAQAQLAQMQGAGQQPGQPPQPGQMSPQQQMQQQMQQQSPMGTQMPMGPAGPGAPQINEMINGSSPMPQYNIM